MRETSTHATRVFICGSALKGQPDHKNLQDAVFIKSAQTLAQYKLHAVENGWHPAIYEVAEGGISIPGEVYELTPDQYEHLIATEPPNMYPGTVYLQDGEAVTAILYPRELVEQYNWPDISHYGGWAAYKAAKSNQA